MPNRRLEWSVIASVLILSVASRLGVFRRNVMVSGTDMGAFGAMTEKTEIAEVVEGRTAALTALRIRETLLLHASCPPLKKDTSPLFPSQCENVITSNVTAHNSKTL